MPKAADEELRDLARSLDCLTESQVHLLAGVTPGTAEAWRKRGKGPAYVLFGNRYLYPRAAVSQFLQGQLRERSSTSAKGLL